MTLRARRRTPDMETSTNGTGAAVEAGRARRRGCRTPSWWQAKRRTFTAQYKARILAEADPCTRPGEVGELLRREGLYTSHLTYWRKQRKGRGAERARQGAGTQAARQARSGDRCADAQARALRGRPGQGASGDRDPGKPSQRCWKRCSEPTARAGAPSDDRGHGPGTDPVDRDPAGLPGARRVSGDDLPSPPPAAAQAPAAAADAGARAVAGRAPVGAQRAARRAVRRRFAGGDLRDAAGRRDLPVLAPDDVPDPRRPPRRVRDRRNQLTHADSQIEPTHAGSDWKHAQDVRVNRREKVLDPLPRGRAAQLRRASFPAGAAPAFVARTADGLSS